MTAWRTQQSEPGFLAVELPAEPLRDDEVRVEVEAAVITARDLDSAARSDSGIPGRAAIGRVCETGAAASEWLGQRVIVGPHQACGECNVCQRGLVEHCRDGFVIGAESPGTLQKTLRARARWLCPVGNDLAALGAGAALVAGPVGLAYGAFCRAGIGSGEPIVIIGSDAVARFIEQIAYARGAHPVRTTAEASEAAVLDRVATVRDIHNLGTRQFTVFETTETSEGRSLAMTLAAPGAMVVMTQAGAVHDDAALADSSLVEHTLTLVSIQGTHPDLYPEILAMAARHDIDLQAAADVLSLADLPMLAERARQGEASGRVPVVVLKR